MATSGRSTGLGCSLDVSGVGGRRSTTLTRGVPTSTMTSSANSRNAPAQPVRHQRRRRKTRPHRQPDWVERAAELGHSITYMTKTPQSRLREVMIEVLQQMGGSGRRMDVLKRMAHVLRDELNHEDRESPRGRPHEEHWQNRASFERANMVRDGVLEQRSDGVWSLTRKSDGRSGAHGRS